MWGDGEGVVATLWVCIDDLVQIDDRGDDWVAIWDAFVHSCGARGPNWLAELLKSRRCLRKLSAEVASMYAEMLSQMGWLEQIVASSDGRLTLRAPLTPEEWATLRLDDPKVYQCDWTRAGLDEAGLPPPCLVVGGSVSCFIPPDGGQWAYFDFGYARQDSAGAAPLLDVRGPAKRRSEGVRFPTPKGTS